MTKPKLGDRITITAVLEKTIRTEGTRYWTEFKSKIIPEITGMYIGCRNAPTGYTIYDPDDGPIFRQKGTELYYLVVTHERKNAILADPFFTKLD